MGQCRRAAFTIVELIVVVVVIAIIAVIATVAFGNVRQRAAESAIQSDLRQAMVQLRLSKLEGGQFPPTASNIKKSQSVVYQYVTDGQSYCLTATANGASKAFNATHLGSIEEGVCSGHFSSVIALGGAMSEIEDGGNTYRVHRFTGSGTLEVLGSISVEYLVVGGGGGAGGSSNSIRGSGGGGAGGAGVLVWGSFFAGGGGGGQSGGGIGGSSIGGQGNGSNAVANTGSGGGGTSGVGTTGGSGSDGIGIIRYRI